MFRDEETSTERSGNSVKGHKWLELAQEFQISGCLTFKAADLSKGADEEKGTQVPLLEGWKRGRMWIRELVTTTLGDACSTPGVLHSLLF